MSPVFLLTTDKGYAKIVCNFNNWEKQMQNTEKKRTKSIFWLLRRFMPYYKKYKWVLLLDLLCASLTTLCEVVLPMIVREITGAATADPMSLTIGLILRCGVLYILLRVIDTVANYYMSTTGHIMGTAMETDMRHDMFAHLQKFSFSYYHIYFHV